MTKPPFPIRKRGGFRRHKQQQDPYNVPSQEPSLIRPYDPGEKQPDIRQFPNLQKPHPLGYGPFDAFVLSTYDSRPVNAYDFMVTAEPGGAVGPPPVSGNININFAVPVSRRYIIRHIEFQTLFIASGYSFGVGFFQIFGVSPILINMKINGTTVPEYAQIFGEEAVNGSMSFDCFIIVEEQSIVTLNFTYNATTEVGDLFAAARASFYGNSLLSSSTSLTYEPASRTPIPVSVKTKENK